MLLRRLRKDKHFADLLSGASVALVMRGAGSGLSLLFSIIIARRLGSEGAGQFFLCLSVIAVAALLSEAGLGNPLVRLVSSNAAEQRWGVVRGLARKAVAIGLAVSGPLLLLILVLGGIISESILKKPEIHRALLIMAFAVVPCALFYFHGELLRGLRKIFFCQLVQGVTLPLFAIAVLLLMRSHQTVEFVAISYVTGSCLALVFGVILWRFSLRSRPGQVVPYSTSSLLESSMPLLWAALANHVINRSSVFLLGIWETSDTVGLYAISSRLALMVPVLLLAVNNAVAPQYAVMYSRGDTSSMARVARNSVKLMTLAVLPLAVLFVGFPKLVLSLFGSDFTGASMVLQILTVGQFVNVATGSVGVLLMMSGREKLVRNNAILTGVFVLFLNVLFIHRWGIVGAALATSIGIMVKNIVLLFLVRTKLGIKLIF